MRSPVVPVRLLNQRMRRLKYIKRYKLGEIAENNASVVADNDEIYIPRVPTPSPIDSSKVEEPPSFDKTLITHLERLSLVRFSDEQAVFNLKQAVRYANQLKLVDTMGIKPLESLLEDVPCPLREDLVDDPMSKNEVLMNAVRTAEDYFVTPPGNIPLEESDCLNLTKVEDWDRKAMDERKR